MVALVYRAMSYGLMRLYEYKKTGIGLLDSEAEDVYLWLNHCYY